MEKYLNRRVFLRASMGTALGLNFLHAQSSAGNENPLAQAEKPSTGTRLVDQPQVKRDFRKDGRSRKVILVAHCVLNQNARHVDCADFPAVMKPLLAALEAREIGIIQMPCPELMALGLGRDRDVPPLDTIREALELPEAATRLKPFLDQIVYQIKEYQWQDFQIIGVLGKNGSPSCGVETTSLKTGFAPGEGIFIRLLRERFGKEGIKLGIKGVDDHRQQEAIDWVSGQILSLTAAGGCARNWRENT
jgi:predicted secreted protein